MSINTGGSTKLWEQLQENRMKAKTLLQKEQLKGRGCCLQSSTEKGWAGSLGAWAVSHMCKSAAVKNPEHSQWHQISLSPFSSDMPECEFSIKCHSAEGIRVIADPVTSPNHTAHLWKLLGGMGLLAEHSLMYLMGSTPTQQGRKCLGKEGFLLSAQHRCIASVAVLPGDFPHQSALWRADIVCLGHGVTHPRNLVTTTDF